MNDGDDTGERSSAFRTSVMDSGAFQSVELEEAPLDRSSAMAADGGTKGSSAEIKSERKGFLHSIFGNSKNK